MSEHRTAAAIAAVFFILAGGALVLADGTEAGGAGPSYLGGTLTVTGPAEGDYFLTADGAMLTITAGAPYQGTVSCGFHGRDGDLTFAALTLSGAGVRISARELTYGNGDLALQVETLTAGTVPAVTVLQGPAVFGLEGPVTAEVTAGAAAISLREAQNAVIEAADGVGRLNGLARPLTGTVTVAGTAVFSDLTVAAGAELTVAAGAVLTGVPAVIRLADFACGNGVLGSLSVTAAALCFRGTAVQVLTGTAAVTAGQRLVFAGVPDGVYTLAVTFAAPAGAAAVPVTYYDLAVCAGQYLLSPTHTVAGTAGTAQFVPGGTADGPAYDSYKVVFPAGDRGLTPADVTVGGNGGRLIACERGTVTCWLEAGTADFPNGDAVSFWVWIAGQAYPGRDGLALMKLTVVPAGPAADGTFRLETGAGLTGLPAAGTPVPVGARPVPGTLVAPRTPGGDGTAVYPLITAAGGSSLTVTGRLTYDSETAGPLTAGVNAAYFGSPAADPAAPRYTYVYGLLGPVLAEAAKAAGDRNVTVLGRLTQTADLGVPAGTAGGTLTLTVAAGAVLRLGTAGTAVTMTVPTLNGLILGGLIDVVNGSFRVAGLTADGPPYTYDPALPAGVRAAVFMNGPAYGVFTDLAAALNAAGASAEKEDLALRTDAYVVKDCGLSAEDALDLRGRNVFLGDLTFAAAFTPTFTVSGTVLDSQPQENGIGLAVCPGAAVLVDRSDTDGGFRGYLLAGGTLTVAEEVSLLYTEITALCGTLNAAGRVAGNVTLFEAGGLRSLLQTAGAGTAEIDQALTRLQNADGTFVRSLRFSVPGELTLTGGTESDPCTIGGGRVENYCHLDTLTLDIAGLLNLSGTFSNSGRLIIDLDPDGRLAAADGAALKNTSGTENTEAGVMQLNLAGTVTGGPERGLNVSNYNPAAGSLTVNVTGPAALFSVYDVGGRVNVTGTGGLSLTEGKLNELMVIDTAVFTAVRCRVDVLTVRDAATAVPETAGNTVGVQVLEGLYVCERLTVGGPPTEPAAAVNRATVRAALTDVSDPDGGTALVYGTAAGVELGAVRYSSNGPAALVQTAMWLVGGEDCLYATQYAMLPAGGTAAAIVQEQPPLTFAGYTMNGWFDAREGGSPVAGDAKVGQYRDIYAIFAERAYTLTLTYVPGAVYLVNERQMPSGQSAIGHGDILTVGVTAAAGYSAEHATVSAGGATARTLTIAVTGDVTVTAAGQTVDLKNASGVGIAVSDGAAWIGGTIETGTVTVNGTFSTNNLQISGDAVFNVPAGSTVTAVAVPYDEYTFNIAYKSVNGLDSTDGITVYEYGNETALTTAGYTVDITAAGTAKFSAMGDGIYTVVFHFNRALAGAGSQLTSSMWTYDVVLYGGQAYIVPTFSVTLDSTTAAYVAAADGVDAHYDVTFKVNFQSIIAPNSASNAKIYVYDSNGDPITQVDDITKSVATVSLPVTGLSTTDKTQDYYLAFADTTAVGAYGNTQVAKLTLTATVSGTAAAPVFDNGTVAMAFTDTVTASAKATVTSTYSTNSAADFTVGNAATDKATVNVAGTVDLSATAYKALPTDTKNSYLCSNVDLNAGTLTVTGKVTFQMAKWASSPLVSAAAALAAGDLVINTAAYAAVVDDTDLNNGTTVTDPLTVTCTNFADALTGAQALTTDAKVSVMGTVTVTEDVTIPTATKGETGKNTLEIDIGVVAPAAYGELVIGTADKAAVVTVPKDASDNVFALNVTNGLINVLNGELKIEGLTEDAAAYDYITSTAFTPEKVGVKAAVFMTDDTYGIYTDLAAALAVAAASAEKDTVTLRTDAVLVKDATLSAEDTLDLTGYNVLVGYVDATGAAAGAVTLTVNGTVASASAAVVYIVDGSAVAANTSDSTADLYLYQLGISIEDAAAIEDLKIVSTATPAAVFVTGGALTVGADAVFGTVQIFAMGGTITVDGKVTSQPMLCCYADAVNQKFMGIINNDDSKFTLTVAVNGELSVYTSNWYYFTLPAGSTLNLNVIGTLNLVAGTPGAITGGGNLNNDGTMTLTVAADGKVVPTGGIWLNNNAAGTMTIDVAGTVVYDENVGTLSVYDMALAADNGSFALNVSGTADLYAVNDYNYNLYNGYTVGVTTVTGTLTTAYQSDFQTLNVTGTGAVTLRYAYDSNINYYNWIDILNVSDSAKVLMGAGSEIITATVTGTATLGLYVAPTAGVGASVNPDEHICVATLTVGTASQKLAENVNGATVDVYLYHYRSGSGSGTATVYGTAANVTLANADELVSTVMYLAGDENILYATQYSTATTTSGATTADNKLALPALNNVEGYSFNGWFDARVGGNTVTNGKLIGDYTGIYAQFTVKTYTLTLNYVEGAVYVVNDNQLASGTYQYDYNTALTVRVIAADGYNADQATVTVGTGAAQTEASFTMTADTTVTAAGLTAAGEDDGGLSLTDILLIVLVIITAIVAVAVVLKLARS